MKTDVIYITIPEEIKKMSCFNEIKEQVKRESRIDSYEVISPLLNSLLTFTYKLNPEYIEYTYVNKDDSEIDLKTMIIKMDSAYYILVDTSFMGGFTSFYPVEDENGNLATDVNIMAEALSIENAERLIMFV